MNANLLYEELLAEIADDERALDEKRQLATLLKKRLERYRSTTVISHSSATVAHSPTPHGATQIAKDDDADQPTASLTQMVGRAVKALGEQEFVVGDVYDTMVKMGLPFPSERANPRITTVLKRMFDAGTLVRTFEGGGNVPHRYRAGGWVPSAAPAKEPETDDLGL